MQEVTTHGPSVQQFQQTLFPICLTASWVPGLILIQAWEETFISTLTEPLPAGHLWFHGIRCRCFLATILSLLRKLFCMKPPISLIYIFRTALYALHGIPAMQLKEFRMQQEHRQWRGPEEIIQLHGRLRMTDSVFLLRERHNII